MISVCMATYNGARFIKQQIDSILSQLSDNDELIISDDGSSDGTLEIIDAYYDKRIKVFNHEKTCRSDMYRNFRFVTENFENALNQAHGDYIFLTDQDDIWLPSKVERCMKLFREYDCIVHNYQIIDIDNNIVKKQNFNKNPIHRTLLANIMDNHYRGCCMAFKRDMLKYVLPIPENVIGHDYWIGTLSAYYGKVYYEIEPLIQSRRYSQSVSAYRKTTIPYKIKHRIDLMIAVLKRITM